MQLQKKTTWLACYIYYSSSRDFKIHEVFPVIKTVLKNNWTEQYFFIRFRDKQGGHIRLRFKGDQQVLETSVKPLLEKKFPDSRFVTYRPELRRYGGKYGITIAEKIFEASSKTVFAFLAENEDVNYERSLGFAMQLNLSMMHALGMNQKEAAAFFDHLALHGDIKKFAANYSKQKSSLLPPLLGLWEALDQQRTFDKPWFNTWLLAIKTIGEELQSAYHEGNLRPLDPEMKHKQNPLWSFYDSCVHMNNNRLRIHNNDENYIAYILQKTITHAK